MRTSEVGKIVYDQRMGAGGSKMLAPRKSRIVQIIPILIAISLAGLPAQAKYGGGTGEPNDPYQIWTPEQMNTIGLHKEDWGKHFRLMTDIDVSAYAGRSFNMIGDYATPFKGVFDGNSHTISNFKISRSSSPIGMFGYLNDPNTKIKNLGLINPTIQERMVSYVGSIVGSLRAGTISNCYVKGGSIYSSNGDSIGGVVGENRGTVSDCNSTANVFGGVGNGGIVGRNRGTIIRCHSSGEVSGPNQQTGGIAGNNSGNVIECWVTGTISAFSQGGGLVGANFADGMIINCYSHAGVSSFNGIGGKWIGGLVGWNGGSIRTCYSVGSVIGTKDVGGLVGVDNKGQVLSSFWDVQTSGQTTSGGGTGKTTAEMQSANTFVDWGRYPVWTIDEGKDYPRLAWQNMPGKLIGTLYGGGRGTQADPYLIYTSEQLNAIGTDPNDWDKHFRLMADLDLEGVTLNPIGDFSGDIDTSKPFSGTFDGNGKTISNFRANNTGIFEYVSGDDPELEYLISGVEIRDLTLTDPNVQGYRVGSLVGFLNYGSVKGCSVINGQVSGGSQAGGLIGLLWDGIVEDCAVMGGRISGFDEVGGLIGFVSRSSVIKGCYSSAVVSGRENVGGLAGLCTYSSIVTSCGATGAVHGTGNYVGGLVGNCGWGSSEGDCTIAGSFASGDVSGSSRVGGLAGVLSYSQISCSYATGHVSGVDYVGGLVGVLTAPRIIDSYAAGRVEGTGNNVGGFSGNDWGPAYDCFWDTETSGMSGSGLGRGLTTLQMQDPNTFISAGWDFVGETANGPSDIWNMPEGGGYPILSWQASPLPPLPSFSGGTGEPNDPFIISKPEELNSIGCNPRLMGAHFRLANDIDLAATNFFLIGSEDFPFMGVFDGNGQTISHFSHEAKGKYRQNIGFFRYVRGWNAEIRNLVLTNSNVINQIETVGSRWDDRPENIGSLVGLLYEGLVFNCHVEDSQVTVKMTIGGDDTGGLIGYNMYGIIDGCTSFATVKAESGTGGLLGCNRAGFVIYSHSAANVVGDYAVGGLVGSNWALIGACSTSGSVSGYEDIGGLVGWNVNAILESCSYAGASGSESVGGLVGENLGLISNSYARATVSGTDSVGGLVGDNTYVPRVAGSVVTCYSTSSVTGKTNVGGLLHRGDTAATTSDDCFWDIQTSGQTTSDGGIGKTTAEMQTAKTFLDAGWDFVGETANGTEDTWWIDEGKDYPRLWWEAHNN